MDGRRLSGFQVLMAAAGGTGLAVLCLVASLVVADMTRAGGIVPAAAAADAPQGGRPRPPVRITYDPDFQFESRRLGPAQQFEIRLRLVLPSYPQGYGIGMRRTVGADQASMGRFVRLSARLPGPVQGPRPRLELFIISRDSSR